MRTELIRKSLFCTAFLTGAFLFGCTEESVYTDVDGQNPSFELTTEHIRTLTGYEFTMSGKVSDKDGISSINLYCPELFLDKTINLVELYSEIQYEYDLSYSFTIPEENKGESFKVKVTITDLGGRTTESEILITMDGDYTAPEFSGAINDIKIITLGNYTEAKVEFSAIDDKGLDFLSINVPELEIKDTIYCDKTYETVHREFTYSKNIKFPSSKLGVYKMYAEAVDLLGNFVLDSCDVTLSLIEDYEKMYLSDVETEAELNSDIFGVPMLIDHTGLNKYRARYYCSKANTEIYFIPQKNSFGPVRIGVSPVNETMLSLDADAKPLVLTEANVYYEINIDLMESTYIMRKYSIDDACDPWADNMEIGKETLDQWANGGNPWTMFKIGWSNSSPKYIEEFTQDETNPHLFYVDKTFPFSDGNNHNIMDFNFFISNYHSDGWWDFISWYMLKSLGREEGVFARFTDAGNGTRYINPNYDGPTVYDPDAKDWTWFQVSQPGTYRFYFDAHLGRGKLLKIADSNN